MIASGRPSKCLSPVTTFADALLAVAKMTESAIPHSSMLFFRRWFSSPAMRAIERLTGATNVRADKNSKSSSKEGHFSLRYFP